MKIEIEIYEEELKNDIILCARINLLSPNLNIERLRLRSDKISPQDNERIGGERFNLMCQASFLAQQKMYQLIEKENEKTGH